MIWIILLSAGIAHAVLLIATLILRVASSIGRQCLIGILLVIVCTCVEYLFMLTGWIFHFPHVFGMSYGTMLLIGPLLYLYTRSITRPEFEWKWSFLMHGIPYGVNVFLVVSMFSLTPEIKNRAVRMFLAGELPVRPIDAVWFTFQCLHLIGYAGVTLRVLRKNGHSNPRWRISWEDRVKWIRFVTILCASYAVLIFGLMILTVQRQFFDPELNFIYAGALSVMAIVVAYILQFRPEWSVPSFQAKYETQKKISDADMDRLFQKMKRCLEDRRIFLDPDLTLEKLAAELNFSPHDLSRVINEKTLGNFNDLINTYRVEEFIRLCGQPSKSHFSIYGLALEAGFRSKSSFNAAFKRITGRSPSDFRRPQ
jgi:AraC-like DNA-binding protein